MSLGFRPSNSFPIRRISLEIVIKINVILKTNFLRGIILPFRKKFQIIFPIATTTISRIVSLLLIRNCDNSYRMDFSRES